MITLCLNEKNTILSLNREIMCCRFLVNQLNHTNGDILPEVFVTSVVNGKKW